MNQTNCWRPQFLRYMLAGVLVFFLGSVQYTGLYRVIPQTACHAAYIWLLNFVLGTTWAHAIHRRFTFRSAQKVPYLTSLGRTYFTYAGTTAGGAILMLLLCDLGGWHHLSGWFLTNAVTSAVNFWTLRSYSVVSRESI